MSKLISLAALLLVACGGAQTTTPEGAANASESEAHDGEKHQLPPGLGKFYAVFGSIAHAEPSSERATQACIVAPKLEELAVGTEGKAGDAESEESVEYATASLTEACKTPNEQAGIDKAIDAVHHAVHEAMEREGVED